MDKRMNSTATGTRNVKVEGWYCETEGLAVLGSLYCSVHATSLCSKSSWGVSEDEAGWVHWREGLSQAQTKHCQGWVQWGKSQILKSPLLFPDLGHTMKNNCAETWRETGCGAGRSFSTLKAQLSHHVLNAPPCPHSTNKGFPRKPPKEAESCTFKEETVKSQKDRARRMLRVTAPTPEAGSAPQARGRIHRTLKNHPKNWYGRLYDTLRSLSFPSPLARG